MGRYNKTTIKLEKVETNLCTTGTTKKYNKYIGIVLGAIIGVIAFGFITYLVVLGLRV